MMKKLFCLLALFLMVTSIKAQMKSQETEDWSGRPAIVTPGTLNKPPSDAIVLYGGAQDLANWTKENGEPAGWIADSCLTVKPKTGSIITKRPFGDCQLHIEWRTPSVVSGNGQDRGNSGVYLMGKYEVQVLDSYENETYYNGQAGAIYKQYIPLVNASLGPGKWQTYDIVFSAPKFNEKGELLHPSYFTVFHNGVLIQNHVQLKGPTENVGIPLYKAHGEKLPLLLQDHSNPVSYRNIWIREL